MTEPPFDADDQAFLASAIRGLQGDLPDDARMRQLERLVAPVLIATPPLRWWERTPARLAGGAAIVVVALGGAWVASRSPSPPPAPITTPAAPLAAPAAPPSEPIAITPPAAPPVVSVDALPSVATAVLRPGSVTAHASDAPPPDPGDELALLEEARHALASDPARALALAEAHAKRFRTPALAQERERVAIDALVRLGRRGDAEARAKAFEAAYPDSAHLARVRALVAPRAVP